MLLFYCCFFLTVSRLNHVAYITKCFTDTRLLNRPDLEICSSTRYFLARDVIYTSRTYATMSASVCLSVTEVLWCIIANLGFKFRSQFTAHCGRSACVCEVRDHRREEWRDHLALCYPLLGPLVLILYSVRAVYTNVTDLPSLPDLYQMHFSSVLCSEEIAKTDA